MGCIFISYQVHQKKPSTPEPGRRKQSERKSSNDQHENEESVLRRKTFLQQTDGDMLKRKCSIIIVHREMLTCVGICAVD